MALRVTLSCSGYLAQSTTAPSGLRCGKFYRIQEVSFRSISLLSNQRRVNEAYDTGVWSPPWFHADLTEFFKFPAAASASVYSVFSVSISAKASASDARELLEPATYPDTSMLSIFPDDCHPEERRVGFSLFGGLLSVMATASRLALCFRRFQQLPLTTPSVAPCSSTIPAARVSDNYSCCDPFNGSPVNSTDSIVGPLLTSLDYTVPKFTIEVRHALLISRIFRFLWMLFSPWFNHPWVPGPLLLPAEVYKIGVTHYFSHEKAREELGYVPIVSPHEGMSRTISYWRQRKQREIVRPNILFWVFCIGGMLGLFYTAFLPPLAPLRWLNSLALLIFRSTPNLRLVFYVAAMLHAGEGICIWLLARRVDPSNARAWFVQTVLLGYPSARLLLKRIH